MEDRESRNCSAEPKGTSGLANWASWIFCFSSSVGTMVRIFWSRERGIYQTLYMGCVTPGLVTCTSPILGKSPTEDFRGAEVASLVLTSIPSLLTANSSKLSTAVLIIWMGGSTVRPMLMALLLFGSNTTTTFLPSVAFCKEDRMDGDSQAKGLLL